VSCIVQKFGGTSVATLERIQKAADVVAHSRSKYEKLVIVVSAMAGTTNKFVGFVNDMGIF
jgi:aspartate kinase